MEGKQVASGMSADNKDQPDPSNKNSPSQSDDTEMAASGDSFVDSPCKSGSGVDEQTNNLAFINEELNFLNQASGGLATNIHKSNKQVRQDLARKNRESSMRRRELYKSPIKRFAGLISRGLKRSPAKLNPRKAKIRRKMTGSGQSSMEAAFESNEEEDDFEREESSDDEDRWKILEDSDTEIDKTLEANAQKSNLTATNVKNILHQVITNEQVVAMVRNSLMSDDGTEGDKEEALYEPKMTRSKVKHIMEEEGDIPHPWPLSPLKQPRVSVPKILDLEFSEDEEDDEYDPDKESHSLSDEDSESVTSSRVSDIGSPIPSTPRTPCTPQSTKLSDISITPSTRSATHNEDSLQSPMGPPSSSLLKSKSTLGKRYQDAMAATNDELTEEETIALRTRSKLSLAETSLTEIESTFVAPDITADMYDTECDDKDWQSFLTSLIKPPVETEDTNDGCEDEDPEYNFLEEKELQEDIKEDQRDDRAVRVSKKEMNELMDEMLEAYEESTDIPEEEKEKLKLQARTNLLIASKKAKKPVKSGGSSLSGGLRITESERQQLDHQMRKHVQLLTQIYVLSQCDKAEYSSTGNTCKFLLKELKSFADSSSVLIEGTSAFSPCNLEPAIELISEPKEWKQLDVEEGKQFETPEKSLTSLLVKNYPNLSNHQKDMILEIVDDPCGRSICDPKNLQTNSSLPPLTKQQKNIIWNSPVFMYPELLPHTNFLPSIQLQAKKRVTFTEAEDNLLALGYEQFNRYPLHRELIQKFLLPCKTAEQIKIRIKNLTASKTPNIIKTLKSTKKLPDFPCFDDEFDICQMLPPMKQTVTRAHAVWCKEFKIKEIIGVTEEGNGIKRASSVNLPVSSRRKSVKVKDKPHSAPSTPAEHLATKTSKPLQPKPMKYASQEDKYIMADTTSLNSPVQPKIRCLQQEARRCSSPGFISLDDQSMDVDGQPSSPVNVRKFHKDLFPSPSRLASQSSPRSVTPVPADVTMTSTSTKQTSSGPVEIRPCISAPLVIIQGSPAVTCTAPTFVVINSTMSKLTLPQSQIVTPVTSSLSTPVCTPILAECSTKRSVVDTASVQVSVALSCVSTTMSSTAVCVSPSLVSQCCNTDKAITTSVHVSPVKNTDVITVPVTSPMPISSPSSVASAGSVHSDVQCSPNKSALEIISSYGPFIYSPSKNALDLSPVKNYALSQEAQERTPTKHFTPRYRPVVPNPFTVSPVKTVSPFLEKKVVSPRHKQLNKKAQAICPKGFIIKSYVSPSKKAATNIVQRVLKRGTAKILPKPQSSVKSDYSLSVTNLRRAKRLESLDDDDDDGNLSKHDTASEYDTLESEYLSDENPENDSALNTDTEKSLCRSGNKSRQKQQSKHYESQRSMESDDTQSETEDINDLYDSQNDDEEDIDDEDHLAELMAASTTIGFPHKKVGPKDKDNRSKAKKKKDSTLAMLAPDLLSQDPHKDDRDTAFAQAYLTRAKEILKDNLEVYEAFLRLLYDFGKSEQSPVKLYKELVTVLRDYPDLINDFAGFLLPEQAVECGCFMATQEFIRARTLLRKLEIYFERHPSHFQKCMKVLCKWSQKPSKKASELRDALEPLLKGHTHLLEELSLFFEDERPPESYLTDYEEIVLGDSDEDVLGDDDGFEEVVLPEEEELDGTKKCQCKCHHSEDNNFMKRNKHCYSCCLKVIDGELFYRVNSKVQKKVKVIFHKPVKARSQRPQSPSKGPIQEDWSEDDTGAEKENVDITMLPDLSKSRSMSIKMKISSKKKAKGRFMTLNEAAESPQKTSTEMNTTTQTLDSPIKLDASELGFNDIGACQSQTGVGIGPSQSQSCVGTGSGQSQSHLLNRGEISPTPPVFESDKLRNTSSGTIASNANQGCNVTLNKSSVFKDTETLSQDPDSFSQTQGPGFDGVEEAACLSPRKPQQPAVGLLQMSEFGSPSKDSMSSDILAKAVKAAMIGKGDLSLDTLFALGSKSQQQFSKEPNKSAFSMVRYLGQGTSSTSVTSSTSLTSSVVSSSDDVVRVSNNFTDNERAGFSNVTSTVKEINKPEGQPTLAVNNNMVLQTTSARTDFQLPVVEDSVSSSGAKDTEDDMSAVQHAYCKEVPQTVEPANCVNINIADEISNQSVTQTSTGSASLSLSSKSNSSKFTEKVCQNVLTSVRSSSSADVNLLDKNVKKVSDSLPINQHGSPQQPSFLYTNIIKEPGTPEIASSVIGFGVEADISDSIGDCASIPSNKNLEEISDESLSKSSLLSQTSETEQSMGSPSGSALSEDSCSNSHQTWSRETDRLILESVKINGPSGRTFEKLSKQLGDRTAAEISKRFHCLLELLVEEETPSEDEDDKSSSSQ